MNLILKTISWKCAMWLSVLILLFLIVFSFYGLYSNKFYFFKYDNYIIPLVTLVHFTYLYAFWFKTKEQERADIQMRNLEFALYIIFFMYIFKLFETLMIVLRYKEFEEQILPKTFLPVGCLIVALYVVLLGLTLLLFEHRKRIIGSYKQDYMNEQIDRRL